MRVETDLGPIHVEDQGTADQAVALLWPSLFTDHGMWRHQLPMLHAAGWRTLAIDPPTHGRSPGPGRRFTMDECAKAALRVLEAAGVTEPVVLFETSWGGFVAPRVALRAPERVRGQVLFNTSADAPRPSQRAKATLLTTLLPVKFLNSLVDRINLSTLLSSETRHRKSAIGADIVRGYRAWGQHNLGQAVDANLAYLTPTATSVSVQFNSTGGSAFASSLTLSTPPGMASAVPEPAAWGMMMLGIGRSGSRCAAAVW